MNDKPTMLMILDGIGVNEREDGNAFKLAKTPNIDKLMKTCPYAELESSGVSVGLPENQMGNSEVGHLNIGAGRVVEQDLTYINRLIEDGDFFSIQELTEAINYAKTNNSKLHIIGLLSDGGVHSHIRHLFALLELAKRKDFSNVYIHCILDGRDSSPLSAENYILRLEEAIKEKGVGKIASISGRFFAMDRDKKWDRIKKVYDALVYGEGETAGSPISAIEESYRKEIFDEYVQPTVIMNGNTPVATIEDGDSVIFYNFRTDRAKELTQALIDKNFKEFKVKDISLYFVGFKKYDINLKNLKDAFKRKKMINTLGECISKNNLTQLRITEEEKFSYISYYFDGRKIVNYKGEDKIIIESPNVDDYLSNPELNAIKLTDKVIDNINENKYNTIVVDFGNPDIIGHLGNLEATIKSIEAVDECVGRIIEAMSKYDGVVFITSDHGNSELMVDYKTGEPYTANTSNKVPFIIYGVDGIKLKDGKLADVAPTLLDVMEIEKPSEMTGESLIVK